MGLLRRMQVIEPCDEAISEEFDPDLSIKVGFATKDLVSVNQHFGSAESLALYAIQPNQSKLLEIFQFGQLDQDGNESKLEEKIAALNNCAAVYCHAIGSSAVRQLLAKGVQPVKVTDNIAISDLIELLQEEMHSGPSSWLAKAIDRQRDPDANRFDQMEAEGWDE
jgi:nitrogen fixation protein NifX